MVCIPIIQAAMRAWTNAKILGYCHFILLFNAWIAWACVLYEMLSCGKAPGEAQLWRRHNGIAKDVDKGLVTLSNGAFTRSLRQM
jgi:hypothetical protein